MDLSAIHARVVRINEPTLYPSSEPTHFPQYLDSLLVPGYHEGPPPPTEVNRGDKVFAARQHELQHDEALDQDNNFQHEPLTSPRSAFEATIPTRPPPVRSHQRRDHPRPVSVDLWQEEDGRRIRFALSDAHDEDVERRRRRSLAGVASRRPSPRSGAVPVPHQTARSVQAGSEEATQHDASTIETHPHPPLSAQLSQLGSTSLFPLPPPPLPPRSTTQVMSDSDSLSVDDYGRNYDFEDFMHDWQSKNTQEAYNLPFVNIEESSRIRPSSPSGIVRRDRHKLCESDLQGLQWKHLGTERGAALQVRKLLYLNKTTTGGSAGLRDVASGSTNRHYYTFRSFTHHYEHLPAHFGHFQLRNMLAAENRSCIFFGHGSRIMQTSLASPTSQRTVLDLERPSNSAVPFKITCLSSSARSGRSEGLLMAGGFNGEYALLNLAASTQCKPHEGFVSHSRDGIVNHIRLFRDRRSDSPRAAFSANDCKLRVMDIPQMRFVDTFSYPNPINCSVESPDGRLRALVHDGPETLITNADSGAILRRLDAHTEHAFACDWSPCGRYLATGAEDRHVVVWDARNWKRPLQKLRCVMSCARSLHFTDDGALVVAENDDVVSIVDTQTFTRRQDVRFFGSIVGMSLLNGGEELVVANGDQMVGGLLSLQRTPQGVGQGTFGTRLVRGAHRPPRHEYDESLTDVVV